MKEEVKKILDKWLGCADSNGFYRKCALPKEDMQKLVNEICQLFQHSEQEKPPMPERECICGGYGFKPFKAIGKIIHCYECDAYHSGKIAQHDDDVAFYSARIAQLKAHYQSLMLKEYERGMTDGSEIPTQQAYETGKDSGRAEGSKEERERIIKWLEERLAPAYEQISGGEFHMTNGYFLAKDVLESLRGEA